MPTLTFRKAVETVVAMETAGKDSLECSVDQKVHNLSQQGCGAKKLRDFLCGHYTQTMHAKRNCWALQFIAGSARGKDILLWPATQFNNQ